MLPTIFSDIETKLNFDFDIIDQYINSDCDNSYYIDNLHSPLQNQDKNKIVKDYFKSIIGGYNHILISKYLQNYNSLSHNILLPYLNDWNNEISIDNLVIISNPKDSERIAKRHIKKAPIFKSVVNDSVISTTDNDDWKNQRYELNNYFL